MFDRFSNEKSANNPQTFSAEESVSSVSGSAVSTIAATTTAAHAPATMVDENKLLKVIKRLFDGSVKETLGELLQNAQRAGAKNVRFTAKDEATLEISDDGTGLAGATAEQMFAPLLRIADSSYERPEVLAQDAMGVGVC